MLAYGDGAHEAFESGRFGDQEESGALGRGDGEGVRGVAWPVDERACRCGDDLAVNPDGQLAVEHVEPLVFAVVNVQGRARRPARRGAR